MVCSCRVSALCSALAPRDCSKSTQSRATKHGVGLAGKPPCDCVKQQNEPFVLRSQPRRRGNAAHILRFLKQFDCRDPRLSVLSNCAAHSRYSDMVTPGTDVPSTKMRRRVKVIVGCVTHV